VDEFHQRGQVLQAEVQAALEVGQPLRLGQVDQGDMKQLVEDALRHLHDYAYLGEHRLARLRIVEQGLDEVEGIVTHLDRGKALSLLLIDALDKLRPPGPVPKTLTREWVQYTILYDAYVLGELNRDIMTKLYISESSFNRARRRAVRGVARAIAEMERTTQSR